MGSFFAELCYSPASNSKVVLLHGFRSEKKLPPLP
jgi:hypothetical protein